MIKFPNAKINLGLDIVERRPDGYHNIETVFYPIPLKDIVECVPGTHSTTILTTSGNPVDCPMEKNLVYKAYMLLQEKYSLHRWIFSFTRRFPMVQVWEEARVMRRSR